MTAHPITPQSPIPANTKALCWHSENKCWFSIGPFEQPTVRGMNGWITHWMHQPDAPERTLTDAESKASHEAFVVYKAALNSADVFEADFTEGFLAALKYNESLSK